MFTHTALRSAARQGHDAPVATLDRIDAGQNRTVHVRFVDGHEAILKVGTRVPEAFAAEPAAMRLVGHQTDVPVPDVYATGRDPLGYPFAVMEYVPDTSADWLRDVPVETALQVCREAGRDLAALHGLRFPAFGRLGAAADGDLAVVDERDYREMLRGSVARQARLLAETPFADGAETLAAHGEDLLTAVDLDGVEPVFVHGDYRMDNLRLAPGGDRAITAVIDWELPTAGDPLWDAVMTVSVLTAGYGIDAATQGRLRDAFWDGYGGRPAHTPRWRLYELLARMRLARHLETEMAGLDDEAVAARIREHRAAFTTLREGGSPLRARPETA